MHLRKWQSDCVLAALAHFNHKSNHFFVVASPGAGKTVMAAEVAAKLFQQGEIDLVLCLSPSSEVRDGIVRTFSARLPEVFHDGIGSLGSSLTYQKLLTLNERFLIPALRKRMLVIFDEIHHCSGGGESIPNAWGAKVLNMVLSYASYTLSMSGTPWRTDRLPIAVATYCLEDTPVVNFHYGLAQAISDGVCRKPIITLIDNDLCNIDNDSYLSITDALSNTELMYKQIVEDNVALKYILKMSINRLNLIRASTSDAAGLVVAHSIEHANKIKQLLYSEFGQTADIVTYKEKHPHQIIDRFRNSKTPWIVSVGMIAEGTDIPRLHVCCHVTTVRTELYFRQILGRILRAREKDYSNEAYLYTFAEPELKRFATNIQTELPSYKVIYNVENVTGSSSQTIQQIGHSSSNVVEDKCTLLQNKHSPVFIHDDFYSERSPSWHFQGNFREQIINSFSQI